MSGHSKWSTIKREKGATDAKRSQAFTKAGNMIALAAKKGTDPTINFALRLAIDKAKAINMPSNNIDRAIARVKDKDMSDYTEVVYEGYASGGVGVVVECATNNTNRTYPEVKLAFSKFGGAIAEKGSVLFQFDHVGRIILQKISDDQEMMLLEADILDYENDETETIIYTDYAKLAKVRDELTAQGFAIKEAELIYRPKNKVSLDPETEAKVFRTLDFLDDLDDVVNVYTTLE